MIHVENAFYCVAWSLIAFRTFHDKRSGFPALLIPFTFVWEFYALRHYATENSGLIPPPLRPYFVVWFLFSVLHLIGVTRFSREEFIFKLPDRWYGPLMASAIAILLYLFHRLDQRPDGQLQFYLIYGYVAVPLVAFGFMFMILRRNDLTGISIFGNGARIVAQYLSLINRPADPDSPRFLISLVAVTVICDLIFISSLMRKRKLPQ